MTILIAEDDPLTLDALATCMEMSAPAVNTAARSSEVSTTLPRPVRCTST